MTKKPELENALERRCVARVEAMGGMALKLVVLGKRGFLDRTCILPGRIVFFVEFKRQRTGVESAQQATWRRLLTLCGFGVYLVDSDEDFGRALERETSR